MAWYSRSDFRKSFQKFRKLFNFRNAKHSTSKILEIPLTNLNGKKTSDKKDFRKLGYTSRNCPMFWNFGKCCSIRYIPYWKLFKIQTGRFDWMEILTKLYLTGFVSLPVMTPMLPSNRNNGQKMRTTNHMHEYTGMFSRKDFCIRIQDIFRVFSVCNWIFGCLYFKVSTSNIHF